MRGSQRTIETASTRSEQRDHDGISRLCERDILAHRVDDSRSFMSSHNREFATPLPTDQMHITMADRGGREADFHFALLRRIDIDLFDGQRLTKCIAHRSFHHSLLAAKLFTTLEIHCALFYYTSDGTSHFSCCSFFRSQSEKTNNKKKIKYRPANLPSIMSYSTRTALIIKLSARISSLAGSRSAGTNVGARSLIAA